MKTYTVWYWIRINGVEKGLGHETMTDKTAAMRAAMRAARRGYHANVIAGGKLVYAQ